MNVLAVGCHPDDLEIGCGGTLAKYVKQGAKVTMCNVANGNKGHVLIPPDELRLIRWKEVQAGGKVLGVHENIMLDVGDLRVDSYNLDVVHALIDVIRHAEPDLIITHCPQDYMKDHQEVSKMVFDASFSTSCPWETTEKSDGVERPVFAVPTDLSGSPKFTGIVPIYYMDNLAGVNFLPTEYVDISEEIEQKITALDCHESQIVWMRDHDHIDFAEFVKTCARYRGLQCGVEFAEGFRMANDAFRVNPYRVLP